MEIDQEQQVEIENCLKSIRKLKLNGLAELNRKIKEENNIKEEAIVSSTITPQTEGQKEASDINVSLKILEVSKEVKKALHVYRIVQDMVNSKSPGKQINIMNAKQMIDQGKPILESIPKPEAEKYKKQLEEEQSSKVELTEIK